MDLERAQGLPVSSITLKYMRSLIFFAEDSVHEKWIADATPYSWPIGSRLLQALGLLAFALPHEELLMPKKKPHGQDLPQQEVYWGGFTTT